MNDSVMNDADFFTVPEIAARLRLSRATAYRLVEQGTIPTRRFGRSLRVPAAALRAWLETPADKTGRADAEVVVAEAQAV